MSEWQSFAWVHMSLGSPWVKFSTCCSLDQHSLTCHRFKRLLKNWMMCPSVYQEVNLMYLLFRVILGSERTSSPNYYRFLVSIQPLLFCISLDSGGICPSKDPQSQIIEGFEGLEYSLLSLLFLFFICISVWEFAIDISSVSLFLWLFLISKMTIIKYSYVV